MTDRDTALAAFLSRSGWADTERRALAGDASSRRYERLRRGAARAILMDAPPDRGEDVGRFARVDAWLRAQGYSAPHFFAEDAGNGFLLLEDLGDDLFANLLLRDPALETALYAAATDFLAELGES